VDDEVPVLRTERLTLRRWHEADRTPFAEMNADEEVMRDLGGPLDREGSDRKYDRFAGAFENRGYGRWVVEGSIGGAAPAFIGYTGIMANGGDHPLGEHQDIGWRLCRNAWGHGFASEAARASLQDAFSRVGLVEVLAYTAPDNLRSQAVMERLGLQRDRSRDFHDHYDDVGDWHGLVWVATPPS
jgi:RimJ/RimL family protein N-acetyltransferase